MPDDEKEHKGLGERVKERIQDAMDEFLEALEGLVNTPPQLQPIPVREHYPRRR